MKALLHVSVLLLLFLVSSSAAALELTVEGGVVRGTTEAGNTWSRRVLDQESVEASDQEVLIAAHGEHAYACARGNLYELDGPSGLVRWRQLMPGSCAGLTSSGDALSITIAGEADGPRWERTFEVTEEGVEMPFIMPDMLAAFLTMRLANEAMPAPIAELTKELDDGEAPTLPEEHREAAYEALEELGARAIADPTNPWYLFRRAQVYQLLGDKRAAQRTYASIFDLDERHHLELMRLAQPLDRVDPKLGDRAFAMAMRSLLARGFEPNLNRSLVSVMIWLGKPPKKAGDAAYDPTSPRDAAVLERRAKRLAYFAPRVEGATHFYNALYEAARERGDKESAARWRLLRNESYPYRFIAGPSRDAAVTGDLLNVYISVGLAFWLLFMVKLARSGLDRVSQESSKLVRWNLVNRLTRGELLGMIGIVLLSFWALRRVSAGVAIIGVLAAAPLGLLEGTLAHPSAIRFIEERGGDNDMSTFMMGLSAQQAGDTQQARERYEQLPDDARAVHNLGVLLHQEGDVEQAQEKWRAALELEPDLTAAKYNLGQEPRSLRAQQQKLFVPGVPLIATPSPAHWERLWRESIRGVPLSNPFAVITLVDGISPQGEDGALRSWASAAPAAALALLVIAFMLIGLVKRGEIVEHQRKLSLPGYAASMLIPGASRHWSVAGPFITVAFVVALLSGWALSRFDGISTNMLMGIALPSFTRYFGAYEAYHGLDELFWRQLARSWWVFVVVNLLFVAVAEKLRPDPNGPFAREDDAG